MIAWNWSVHGWHHTTSNSHHSTACQLFFSGTLKGRSVKCLLLLIPIFQKNTWIGLPDEKLQLHNFPLDTTPSTGVHLDFSVWTFLFFFLLRVLHCMAKAEQENGVVFACIFIPPLHLPYQKRQHAISSMHHPSFPITSPTLTSSTHISLASSKSSSQRHVWHWTRQHFDIQHHDRQ